MYHTSSSLCTADISVAYGRVANFKTFQPISLHTEDSDKINLVDHFSALLLAIFTEAGLFDVNHSFSTLLRLNDTDIDINQCLLGILEEVDGDAIIVRKSTLLVGELLKLSDKLLPRDMNAKIQMLPSLFRCASQFEGISRKTAIAAVYQIDSLNRTLHRAKTLDQDPQTRVMNEEEKRGQRQVEQVKLKMNMQIDEPHFRSLILDSQVSFSSEGI
jgi:rapamycin-insensitive companion of mTOR